MAITPQAIADEMLEMIRRDSGSRKWKPLDLQKEMIRIHGEEGADRDACKQAIRVLVDSGRCVYTYFGGTYLEIPHEEGAAMGPGEE